MDDNIEQEYKLLMQTPTAVAVIAIADHRRKREPRLVVPGDSERRIKKERPAALTQRDIDESLDRSGRIPRGLGLIRIFSARADRASADIHATPLESRRNSRDWSVRR